jgi:hypothetical protein
MGNSGAIHASVRVLTAASVVGLLIAGGHRAWQSIGARPFLDPRIARLGVPAVDTKRARPFEAEGTEIVVALIGTSRCVGSRHKSLTVAMDSLRKRLRVFAEKRHQRVRLLGVALDDDLAVGLRWLTTVGPFDEISVGGSWLNLEAVHLVHRGLIGEATVPQVVVFRRSFAGERTGAILVSPDRLAFRKAGLEPIMSWSISADVLGDIYLGLESAEPEGLRKARDESQ